MSRRKKKRMAGNSGVREGVQVLSANGVPCDVRATGLPSDQPSYVLQPNGKPLRLNLGSGPNKMDGFLSVDRIAFPGVDVVIDLLGPWPWPDGSVAEVHCSHTLEHFDAMGRCHFANELYRVLAPDGKCTLIVPHWCSCRAYGDPTHCWPPCSEFWFFYLSREWRMGGERMCGKCNGSGYTPETALVRAQPCPDCGSRGKFVLPANAPHTDAQHLPGGFACDLDASWGYALESGVALRSQEAQQFAIQYYKEATPDIIATLKRKA